MKNRIASLFLVFALLMSLCVSAGARDNRITVQSGGAERFTDVPTSHWAYGYINKVVGSGLFNGKTSTTFEPSSAMTRSQFVLVMARMEGRSDLEGVETQTIFPDVTTTRRAAGPIKWATDEGFVNGFGDGTFKPDSPITRGQFAALIHRYITYKRYVNLNVLDPEPDQFADAASVSTAFTADVEYARVTGLLTGYSDGTVRAGNPITRAAIAAILARFLDLVTESGYTPLLDGPAIDNGDSGNTGGATPTPSGYDDDVKMTVNGGTHGAVPTVAITRNGAAVAADDVQPGDRVTISHKPESGYVATVRVRDANNRTVSVNRVGSDTSWFYMPNAMPVTVTVTYERESTGGGGGGGGGGGSSSGGGSSTTYCLNVASSVNDEAMGWTYVSKTNPTARNYKIPASPKTSDLYTSTSRNVPAFAIFVAKEGYELKTVTDDDTHEELDVTNATVKDAEGKDVDISYVTLTSRGGTTKNNAPEVSVTGVFELTEIGGDDEPVNWTVNVNVESEQAYYKLETEKPTAAVEKLDKEGESLTVPNVLNNAKAYLYVTPKDTYRFASDSYVPTTEDADAVIKDVTPDGTNKDNVRVYEIAKSGLKGTDKTTTVDVVMLSTNPLKNLRLNVTYKGVVSNDGESLTNTREFNDTDTVTLEPFVTPTSVQLGDKVTVTAPQTTGFVNGYRYEILDVVVKYATGKEDKLGASKDKLQSPVTYEFEMAANADAEVTVVYKRVEDTQLTYNVKVAFDGKGSMVLNIGGKDYPVSDTNYTIDPITMSHVEYLDKYSHLGYNAATPDEELKLPIYVTTTPIAADGYKYNDSLNGAKVLDSASLASGSATPAPSELDTAEYYLVAPNDEHEVSVAFDAVNTYTYNLTIIGQGTAPIRFGGTPVTPAPSNTGSKPQTFTQSVSSLNDEYELIINQPAPANAEHEYDIQVSVNGKPQDANATGSTSIILTPDDKNVGTANVVVEFHKADREAVRFTVKSGANGTVKVATESGNLVAGTIATAEAAKEALDNKQSLITREADLTVNAGGTNSYYAYEGTIITLTPTPSGSGYKTKSLIVNNGQTDELPSDGFSFTLTAEVVAEATFGTFNAKNAYSVLLQAPFDGTPDPTYDLHSKSTNIKADATMKALLNSFNNGQRNADSSPDDDGIVNSFNATPQNINKAFDYYFNVAKNNEGKTGREALQEMLEKSVAGSLSDNLPIIIEKRKATMLAGDTIEKQLKDTLGDALKDVNATQTTTLPDDNSTKIDIVKKIVEGNDALSGLTVKDFTVTLTVEPLLLSASDTDDAKSLQTQLQSQIMAYLNKVNLDPSYKDNLPEANVNVAVKGYDENGNRNAEIALPPTITISASAKFDLNNLPKLEKSFDQYLDELAIWVNAKIQVEATVNGEKQSFDVDDTLYLVNDLGEETLKDVKAPIQTALAGDDGVDAKLASTWETELKKLLDASGNMNVNMGDVLTKDILDQVVQDNLLGDTANDLFDKVESLGDAQNTKNAFMNLYRDFVVLDDANGLTLSLQTTKAGKVTQIGEVKDNNLVITLDFDAILRDSATPANDTSYERLMDLLVAFRDGISTDINVNATNGQTSRSVIASLIAGQINRGKGTLSGTKWGSPIDRKDSATVQELSALIADLVMTPLEGDDAKLSAVWQKFEAKGYRNVQFEISLSRGRVEALVKSLNYAVDPNGETDYSKLPSSISIGFRMAQIIDGTDGFDS